RRLGSRLILSPSMLFGVAAIPHTATVPGLGYTMRVSSRGAAGRGNGLSGIGGMWNWSGTAMFAAGRGRLDIIEGGAKGVFGRGDYLLFDSTDFIVVRPAPTDYAGLPMGPGG